jgi:hypothetical protein
MIKWTFHDNEIESGNLSQPPELLMSGEPLNPMVQAFARDARLSDQPPPEPPDAEAVTIAQPDPKSGIRAMSSILRCPKKRTKPPGQSS